MADQAAETSRGSSEECRAITVLLVDDHRFIGAVLQRLLATEPDIELHCCYSAVDAVALANHINPTIILQDLVLPDIDGLALVRLFRANARTASTPVIVLSGNDDADTRARARVEGANDYLVKLPPKGELVACIRRHAIASGAVNAGEGKAVSAHAAGASDPRTSETLDRSVLAQFRQANPARASDFTLTLIDGFITEATSQVELLRDARQRQDVRAIKATAHRLKGSSSTMGARRLATLCTQMEEHVADHAGVITLELMTEVDRELVKVRAALAAEWQGGSQP